MSPRMQKQIAKSKEEALAAFVAKTLCYYAELLKRVTDSAFNEGEHAE